MKEISATAIINAKLMDKHETFERVIGPAWYAIYSQLQKLEDLETVTVKMVVTAATRESLEIIV